MSQSNSTTSTAIHGSAAPSTEATATQSAGHQPVAPTPGTTGVDKFLRPEKFTDKPQDQPGPESSAAPSTPAPQKEREKWAYFAPMLHMDDDLLDPFQYRLLGHYRRVCGDKDGNYSGTCWQTTETIAKECKMSEAKVRSTRRFLRDNGYISVEEPDGRTVKVTCIDRMAENKARYADPSRKDEISTHENESSDLTKTGVKEQPSKNNPPKTHTQPPACVPSVADSTQSIVLDTITNVCGLKGIEGRAESILKALVNREKLNYDDAIHDPALAKDVESCIEWHLSLKEGMNPPQDPNKFVGTWNRWNKKKQPKPSSILDGLNVWRPSPHDFNPQAAK
jgi:hypothetical protein